jgi:hypothetical protein
MDETEDETESRIDGVRVEAQTDDQRDG